jgi:CYTH domain-containing protein
VKQLEIERKYLLRPCSPKRFLRRLGLVYRRYFIQQYYLPEQNGAYVRYRRRDDTYFKTVKSGEGMVREEHEYQVGKEEFDAQLKKRLGAIIEKERFVLDNRGVTYEMDRITGELTGL